MPEVAKVCIRFEAHHIKASCHELWSIQGMVGSLSLCQRVYTIICFSLSASVHSFVLESFIGSHAGCQIPCAISRALDCAASAAEEDILLPLPCAAGWSGVACRDSPPYSRATPATDRGGDLFSNVPLVMHWLRCDVGRPDAALITSE